MSFEITVNVDEFLASARSAVAELEEDLHKAGVDAAREGVEEVQREHPYTDRTGNLTGTANVEENHAVGGAFMTWPEDYASYVDGKRAFNFTDHAEAVAERGLEYRAEKAIEKFGAKF